MRKMISNDTGKECIPMKADVSFIANGEGGAFISMCWHEIRELGSVCVNIPAEKINSVIKALQIAKTDID